MSPVTLTPEQLAEVDRHLRGSVLDDELTLAQKVNTACWPVYLRAKARGAGQEEADEAYSRARRILLQKLGRTEPPPAPKPRKSGRPGSMTLERP